VVGRASRLKRIGLLCALGLAAIIVVVGSFTIAVNLRVVADAKSFISAGVGQAESAPVAVIPGGSVYADGSPTPMATDRMETALELYRAGKVRALDVSGYPDEVTFMMRYAEARGVPEKDIMADPAGSDTYDTMRNARDVFHIEKAIVCTQRFHLSRSVYLARSLGIDATGVTADIHSYPGTRFETSVREWAARVKAFLQVHF
jgi:SanA protein